MQAVTGKESYRYDGYGRRVKVTRTSDGKTDYPIYTMGGQLLTEDDARSNRRIDYVSLNGSLVAKRTATLGKSNWSTAYEHTDALHSPNAETNATDTATRIEHYTPYGEPGDHQYVQGPGFTGHVTDAATGLTYAQQRYYDPVMGRFLSADPVLPNDNGGSFNRYWYASDNPYRFTDPDGRDEIVFTWKPGVDAVGHSAIGYQNRDSAGNPTGTYTVKSLWPAKAVDRETMTAPAKYKTDIVKAADIAKYQGGGEGKGAAGIVLIKGDAKQDAAVAAALAKGELNHTYNAGMNMNTCSTYAAAGVAATGIQVNQTGTVSSTLLGMPVSRSGVVTPLAVYNSVVGSGDPRVSVIKAIPPGETSPDLKIK